MSTSGMTLPLWCLAAFVFWNLILVAALSVARLRHLSRGGSPSDFGVPDNRRLIWRLFRAHMNALENLPLFASVILLAALRGVTGRMIDLLAVSYIAARVGQTLLHVSPGAGLRGNWRFNLFAVQVVCLLGLLVLAVWPA
jgi:uncharacterized MAPEG superfamily protein